MARWAPFPGPCACSGPSYAGLTHVHVSLTYVTDSVSPSGCYGPDGTGAPCGNNYVGTFDCSGGTPACEDGIRTCQSLPDSTSSYSVSGAAALTSLINAPCCGGADCPPFSDPGFTLRSVVLTGTQTDSGNSTIAADCSLNLEPDTTTDVSVNLTDFQIVPVLEYRTVEGVCQWRWRLDWPDGAMPFSWSNGSTTATEWQTDSTKIYDGFSQSNVLTQEAGRSVTTVAVAVSFS